MTKNIKLPLLRGQKDKQQERIEKYEKFTGAKLADVSITKTPETETDRKNRITQEVNKQLELIKNSVEAGVSQIICSVSCREVYEALKAKLDKNSLKHTQFPPYDVPVPDRVVKVED